MLRALKISLVTLSLTAFGQTSAYGVPYVETALKTEINELLAKAKNNAKKYGDEVFSLKEAVEEKRAEIIVPLEGKTDDSVDFNEMIASYKTKFNKKDLSDRIPELLVFVSFSMPDKLLVEIGEQAQRAGGVLVFRGPTEGSLTKTFSKMQGIKKGGLSGVINPMLFKKFNINTVPTIVVNEGFKACDNCTPIADKISGTVTIEYALRTFATEGDFKSIAKSHLARLGAR